jgi:hypothetical protein
MTEHTEALGKILLDRNEKSQGGEASCLRCRKEYMPTRTPCPGCAEGIRDIHDDEGFVDDTPAT